MNNILKLRPDGYSIRPSTSTYAMILLIFFILGNLHPANGQMLQAQLNLQQSDTYISIEAENQSVGEILKQIEAQTDFTFIYSNHKISTHQLISIKVNHQPLEDLLEAVLKPIDVNYTFYEKQIVLTNRKSPETIAPKNSVDPYNTGNQEMQNLRKLQSLKTSNLFKMLEITITGQVTDENNESLPGVNILIKNTTTGTVTDVNGNYRINVPEDTTTLVFSSIGYLSQEIVVGNRTEINVQMDPDIQSLEEIVVVGYGTQDKVNLTGSITSVDAEELAEISTPTLTQSIMGRSPGVFIKNENGQPGEDGVSFNIRGFGTPLIIVDGMPVTEEFFQQIDPNDIEQFNILKDASAAAVYGARAGNGVVLVTTKRGNLSAPQFNFSSNFGLQFFTVVPEFVNSAQYASMENQALHTEGRPPQWTREEIQKFRDGTDPEYVDVNWWDETLKPTAPQHKHNLSVRGGTDKIKYFTSIGYFKQKGFLVSDDIDHERFSLRANLDIQLTKRFEAGVDISITNQDYIGPSHKLERSGGRVGIMTRLLFARPFYPNIVHPDPSYLAAVGAGATQNPYSLSFIDNVGFEKWNKLFGFAKLRFGYDLPYGFAVKAIYDLNRTYHRQSLRVLEMPEYDYDAQTGEYIFRRAANGFDFLDESNSILKNINQQYFLTWDREFGDHEFSGLFVYEQLDNNYDFFSSHRRNFEFDLNYLFAGSDLDKDNNGFATQGGRKAFIGRINYNYRQKYMLEVSSRWDGSPNFPPDTRWGVFPSASVGWRISEEGFMRDNISFIDNLKLRASYGRLGFDDTGAFQYLSTFSIRSRYIYDDALSSGIRADALPNPTITWEKMTTSNVGLDFMLFGNKLEGTFDYFYRKRTDVLGARIGAVPDVVGATMPQENLEEYDNRGWELTLRHNHNIGSVNYSLGGNISMNREKTLYQDQVEFATMEAFRRGNEIGEWTDRFWTFPTDGLFRSQEEIDNWADVDGRNNATIKPGDIKYVDTNNDGRITDDDRIIAGRGTMPRLMYGVDISTSWKGFDFMMLWQGAALYNFNLRSAPNLSRVFWANGNPTTFMYHNSYVPEDPENQWVPANTDAIWPRYGTDGYNRTHANARQSQFWLVNGAYVRLKNIQLGYTLPKQLTERWGIDHCKIFLAGYNILTFSKYDFIDPEADTDPATTFGDYHPPVGTYNLGLQLNF